MVVLYLGGGSKCLVHENLVYFLGIKKRRSRQRSYGPRKKWGYGSPHLLHIQLIYSNNVAYDRGMWTLADKIPCLTYFLNGGGYAEPLALSIFGGVTWV